MVFNLGGCTCVLPALRDVRPEHTMALPPQDDQWQEDEAAALASLPQNEREFYFRSRAYHYGVWNGRGTGDKRDNVAQAYKDHFDAKIECSAAAAVDMENPISAEIESTITASSAMKDSPSSLDLNSVNDPSSDGQSSTANGSNDDETSSSGSDASEVSKLIDERPPSNHVSLHSAPQIVDLTGGLSLPRGNTSEASTPHHSTGDKTQGSFGDQGQNRGSDTLASRIPEFLAKIQAANQQLEEEKAAGTLEKRRIEIDDNEATTHVTQYIEMNLGLGVLEEKRDSASSSSENEDSSDGGVMQTLLGDKRKRSDKSDGGVMKTLLGGKHVHKNGSDGFIMEALLDSKRKSKKKSGAKGKGAVKKVKIEEL